MQKKTKKHLATLNVFCRIWLHYDSISFGCISGHLGCVEIAKIILEFYLRVLYETLGKLSDDIWRTIWKYFNLNYVYVCLYRRHPPPPIPFHVPIPPTWVHVSLEAIRRWQTPYSWSYSQLLITLRVSILRSSVNSSMHTFYIIDYWKLSSA